jgi:hypothetical protein
MRNIKVYLKCVRGWLPKEPHLPSLQLEDKQKKLFTRRNALSTFVGIIIATLLAIGLWASFYQVTQLAGSSPFIVWWQIVYPYRNVGIMLLVAGIISVALGFLLPLQRTQQQKISSLGVRNKRLKISGIVFLAIGLAASYIQWTQLIGEVAFGVSMWQMFYPYGNVGIILLLAGIIFIASGFLLHLRLEHSTKKRVNLNCSARRAQTNLGAATGAKMS